ncbi:RDD family protein [Vibrio astriarenae]|uniref:RDD family protein n=1 Tax=Vibrio astriarenae TaxID=1481923 RepID=A0A7Z2T695_9VIBR|nr:RDD family protein [Vibrio astriarenae]QIA65021.1 RDD family protein [Vibrio astriarenae]
MEEQISVKSNTKLASRWSRFWAVIIDSLIAMAYTIPVLWYTDFGQRIMAVGNLPLFESLIFMLYSWVMYLLCHGYLLHTKGQTIGKNVFEIAIVDASDNYIGLPKLFLKRYLPITIAASLPIVGQFAVTIDGLFVFRKDKRCIHDLIAGTKVIALEASTNNVADDSKPLTEA